MGQHRFILVTFPAQGHINPVLQLAKRLIGFGSDVTLVTTNFAYRKIMKSKASSTPEGLSFVSFSDGYDDGIKPGDNTDNYMLEFRRGGSQAISDLVDSGAKEGRPFTCIVFSLGLNWVAEVANELNLPSALLWVEPATVFLLYYYYFNGYEDVIKNNIRNPSSSIEFPGLPLEFTGPDFPSFMDATKPNSSVAIQIFKEKFETLEKESNLKVLVNTFDALEPEALRAIDGKIDLIGIGPLIPSSFFGGKDPSDEISFRGDLFQCSEDVIQWMNTKNKGSVIYISFGTMCVLSKPQMEEIAGGLLDFGRPFLWVITEKQYPEGKKEEDELSCSEELEKLGKIVSWCPQMRVLSHLSLGCFMTHCGWNSTLESLVCGVPMVAFPQWMDQSTNAKLIEDVWKTGVRVKANNEGLVERDEIRRCFDLVMEDGENGEEMKRNAKKWKDLAGEAVKEGGSSEKNFKAFVDDIIA